MTKSVYAYRNGALCVEALPLAEIAEEVESPFFCTSVKQLRRNYRSVADAFPLSDTTIHYTVASNPLLAVLRVLAESGAGAAVTSVGELERALQADVPPQKIIFSGYGKTRDDIAAALLAGVKQLSMGCLSELGLIEKVATLLGKKAPVSLLLDVGGKTKSPQSGLDIDEISAALASIVHSDYLMFSGLSIQLAANQMDRDAFTKACKHLALLVCLLHDQGFSVPHIAVDGCDLSSKEENDLLVFNDFIQIVQENIFPLGCPVSFSMGKQIIADASVLVARVVHTKQEGNHKIILVDVSMNGCLDPSVTGYCREIIPVRDADQAAGLQKTTVMGPFCNKEDLFGNDYSMPCVQEGDLIAVMQTGALSVQGAPSGGGLLLIPEVLVSGAQHAVVRRRVAVAEQIEWETMPDWMVMSRAA